MANTCAHFNDDGTYCGASGWVVNHGLWFCTEHEDDLGLELAEPVFCDVCSDLTTREFEFDGTKVCFPCFKNTMSRVNAELNEAFSG